MIEARGVGFSWFIVDFFQLIVTLKVNDNLSGNNNKFGAEI